MEAAEKRYVVGMISRDNGDYYAHCGDDKINVNSAIAAYNNGSKRPFALKDGGVAQAHFAMSGERIDNIQKIGV